VYICYNVYITKLDERVVISINGANIEGDDIISELREQVSKKGRPIKVRRKKESKRPYKAWVSIALVLVIFITAGVAYTGEKYASWRAEHEWQNPLKWVGFIRELKKSAVEVKTNTEEKKLTDFETIEQYRLSHVLKGIYRKESSAGKNDYCKEKGEFNGFGFRQNTRENKCYKSFDEVTERVHEWLEERLAFNGNNLPEALCYYNQGIAGQDSCSYSTEVIGFMIEYFK